MEGDAYKTVDSPGQSSVRERGSRFLGFAYHIENPDQAKEHIDGLKKKYYDARHICYAWRLSDSSTRANDDQEPSGSAGLPILGQILSRELYDVMVAVVRYFGGTKLGVPGLIACYKASAAEALDDARTVEAVKSAAVELEFGFEQTTAVMKVVKDMQARVVKSDFDNQCKLEISIREGAAQEFRERVEKAGAKLNE